MILYKWYYIDTGIKMNNWWAGKKEQVVKCLLLQAWRLDLNPQNPQKKPTMVLCICSSKAGEARQSRSLGSLTSQQASSMSPRPPKHSLKTKPNGCLLKNTSKMTSGLQSYVRLNIVYRQTKRKERGEERERGRKKGEEQKEKLSSLVWCSYLESQPFRSWGRRIAMILKQPGLE